MPLVQKQLQTDLENAVKEAKKTEDFKKAMDTYFELTSKAIYDFITSGDVVTTGSATNQTGKVE
jgi:hypothetical protein